MAGSFLTLLLNLPWQVSAGLLLLGIALQFASANNPLTWMLSWALIVGAFAALAKRLSRSHLMRHSTSLDAVCRLSWREFEELVTQAFQQQGYVAERTGGSGPDGGVDIIARGRGETVIVQCKHWTPSSKVGVKLVRELGGVIKENRADRAVFITTGGYSLDALEYARNNPEMMLIDGPGLVHLLAETRNAPPDSTRSVAPSSGFRDHQLPAASVAKPLAAATPNAPHCPSCGEPMVLRTARRGQNAGEQFWGCAHYPKCRGTRQLDVALSASEQAAGV